MLATVAGLRLKSLFAVTRRITRDVHGPLSLNDIRIRPATDADGTALAQLMSSAFAEHPGCLFLVDEFPELRAAASHYARRGGALWVAGQGGRVIGSIGIEPRLEAGVFELSRLYVAIDRRGRGVARLLLEQAIVFARAQGGRELRLWTDTRFRDGQRFHEGNGFRRAPGLRALHDASVSLEFQYRRTL